MEVILMKRGNRKYDRYQSWKHNNKTLNLNSPCVCVILTSGHRAWGKAWPPVPERARSQICPLCRWRTRWPVWTGDPGSLWSHSTKRSTMPAGGREGGGGRQMGVIQKWEVTEKNKTDRKQKGKDVINGAAYVKTTRGILVEQRTTKILPNYFL